MEVQELYERCMRGSLRNLIKGGLFYKYFINPYFVWCDSFAPKEEKDPLTPYMDMILSSGRDHEDEVCNEQYPGGISIDPTLHEKAFMQTLEAMFSGAETIKNGILYYLPEGFVAVPDIMVKKPGSSVLGNHHYEIIEIKSSKQIREEHIMQAAYYNHLVGIIQEFTPPTFYMIGRDKQLKPHAYQEYEQRVKETIQDMREIFLGKEVTPSKLNWPWTSFSIKKLKETRHISLIPNLYSNHKSLLLRAGVKTLDDFQNLEIFNVDGIPQASLERYKLSAKALIEGKHAFIKKPFLPEDRVEIFLDFEGVEDMRINGNKVSCDYLIGMIVREDGKEKYTCFKSETPEKEHEMLLEFLKFLQSKSNYIIYHYGSYEKSHFASMFNKYGIHEDMADKIMASMVDVLPLARKHVAFPTHSYSLKELGKYLGFSWRDLGDAKDSIVLYLDYLKNNDTQAMEKIVQYNEDDCMALMKVKDFLVWGT